MKRTYSNRLRTVRGALAALLWGMTFFSAGTSRAAVVCDAEALCSAGVDPCTISNTHQVQQGCLLDFGDRSVTLQGTLEAEDSGGSFSLLAREIILKGTLRSKGLVDDSGGDIAVGVSEQFSMQTGSSPTVNVNGQGQGGTFSVFAGSIHLGAGTLNADGSSQAGDGGVITLIAGGSIVVNSTILATSGADATGGQVIIDGSDVDLLKRITVSGGSGGGGSLDIESSDDIDLSSGIVLRSNADSFDDTGGIGGDFILAAGGDIQLDGEIRSMGGGPDGGGGTIELFADGSIFVGGVLQSESNGLEADGGLVVIDAGEDITIDNNILVEGSNLAVGGDISLTAIGSIAVEPNRNLRANGGLSGGAIEMTSIGALDLQGNLEARGTNAGSGGLIALGDHCSVTLAGTIDARGSGVGDGGFVSVTAGSIVVSPAASVQATPCGTADCVALATNTGIVVIDPSALLDPLAIVSVIPQLRPCCGNGTLNFGETCDDSNQLSCDGCTRQCEIESVPPCPGDGNECTNDCSPVGGCVYQPLSGLPCLDDGDTCTADLCEAGICAHTAVNCDDGVSCTIDQCVSGSGCESIPDDALCNDGNQCTTDTCDAVLDCQASALPDGTQCDDNSLCSIQDACASGVCVQVGNGLNCDDGDPCTVDTCNSAVGCLNLPDPGLCPCDVGGQPLPSGTPCADADPCTTGDTCDGAGTCTGGVAISCDDFDACTADFCLAGICQHVDDQCIANCAGQPDGTPCSDQQVCTQGVCVGNVCVSAPVSCESGQQCVGEEFCVEPLLGCRSSFPEPGDPTCGADAVKTYKAKRQSGAAKFEKQDLTLTDEFESVVITAVRQESVGNPVAIEGGPIGDPDTHFTCYKARNAPGQPKFEKQTVSVFNELGFLTAQLSKLREVCVPSHFDVSAGALQRDSYKCYKARLLAATPPFAKFDWNLSDAFETKDTTFLKLEHVCTPADVEGGGILDPQSLLTCYKVRDVSGQAKFPGLDLSVSNYLGGFGTQDLNASKPRSVCLPATFVN